MRHVWNGKQTKVYQKNSNINDEIFLFPNMYGQVESSSVILVMKQLDILLAGVGSSESNNLYCAAFIVSS